MKKLFLLSFFCLILAACASTPESAPYVPSRPNPEIVIKLSPSSAIVTFAYSGSSWLFIEGVEIINAEGDIKKCMIKSPRRYASGAKVYESGVFSAAYADEFKAWLGDAPRARVVCKLPQSWEPVEVRRE